MTRYAMYILFLILCTACGSGNPPEREVDPGRQDPEPGRQEPEPGRPEPGRQEPDPVPNNTAPTIQLLGAANIQLMHGSEYQDAGATASDAEDGDLTDDISVTGLPIITTNSGHYRIRYRVADEDGATATVVRGVTVAENSEPSITLLGAARLEVEQNATFQDPGATAEDAEDGDITTAIKVDGNVNTKIIGDYELKYSVIDSSGAEAVVTRSVKVSPKPSPYANIPITIDAPGFTTILPSGDSKLVYVSASAGDDFNDGLTPSTPLKTIAKGKELLREGSPDWLLLKIGDRWQEGLGRWVKSGRSATEPMVITAYGEGTERPLLMSGNENGLTTQGGSGSPTTVDNLVVSGLHLYAQTRDPDATTFIQESSSLGIVGIKWLLGSSYLLFEDNYIDSYKLGIQISDGDGLGVSGVVIRRNIIVDSFATNAHSAGLYLSYTKGVKIEENVFDHNGWHDSYPGAHATIFNHSIYIQTGNVGVDIKNNIISRSSSHGMQLRPGGLIEGNFLIRNPMAILLGLSETSPSDGQILGNVILNGNDIGPGSLRRGAGIDFDPITNVIVENNIVAHVMSDAGGRFSIRESTNATYINNIIYKWELGTEEGSSYLDPERTIEEYDELMGGEGTFESFAENIRAQSRLTWNPEYSVDEIRKFFRDGFSEAAP